MQVSEKCFLCIHSVQKVNRSAQSASRRGPKCEPSMRNPPAGRTNLWCRQPIIEMRIEHYMIKQSITSRASILLCRGVSAMHAQVSFQLHQDSTATRLFALCSRLLISDVFQISKRSPQLAAVLPNLYTYESLH